MSIFDFEGVKTVKLFTTIESISPPRKTFDFPRLWSTIERKLKVY